MISIIRAMEVCRVMIKSRGELGPAVIRKHSFDTYLNINTHYFLLIQLFFSVTIATRAPAASLLSARGLKRKFLT